MSESEPIEDASRKRYFLSKPRHRAALGISVRETCLLLTWQTLFRGHDFYPGLFVERRKPHVNEKEERKGKQQVLKCKPITNVT